MTNDITTLNGALAELGETLADNLYNMGVTDADPSDGLTTLVNKVLDIDIPHDYSLNFSQASYIANNGSCTVECILLDNNRPVRNATITLSDGNSTYSSITNSQGVAQYTFNIDKFTCTATWGELSDSCIVKQQIITSRTITPPSATKNGLIRMTVTPEATGIGHATLTEGNTVNTYSANILNGVAKIALPKEDFYNGTWQIECYAEGTGYYADSEIGTTSMNVSGYGGI